MLIWESIFTRGVRAYNDSWGYWKEFFCSLVNYFKFWKTNCCMLLWPEFQDYNVESSNSKYTIKGQKRKKNVWKNTMLSLWEDTFKQWKLSFKYFCFCGGAMLVRVGIRIEETGFLETFQVLIIYVNVWSKQLPFWIGNYVTVNIWLEFYFLVHFWEKKPEKWAQIRDSSLCLNFIVLSFFCRFYLHGLAAYWCIKINVNCSEQDLSK